MARHRSPSGAQAADPDRTMPLRAARSHRLPAPPSTTTRAYVALAALAAGAVVAAGETMIESLPNAESLPARTAAAFLPTTQGSDDLDGVDGDQPLTGPALRRAPEPGPKVDLANLTKAVEIGQWVARRTKILDAALADGAPEAALAGDSAIVRPLTGRLTSSAGPRWGTTHFGLDVANRIGTPIYAVTEGVVEKSGPATGFGLWVVLRHPDGTSSVYGHINRTFVEVGQRVAAGEQIAEVGNRGFSTGPHLHLEIWDENGSKIDPARWFRKLGITF